jgi:hypothetical protein
MNTFLYYENRYSKQDKLWRTYTYEYSMVNSNTEKLNIINKILMECNKPISDEQKSYKINGIDIVKFGKKYLYIFNENHKIFNENYKITHNLRIDINGGVYYGTNKYPFCNIVESKPSSLNDLHKII